MSTPVMSCKFSDRAMLMQSYVTVEEGPPVAFTVSIVLAFNSSTHAHSS